MDLSYSAREAKAHHDKAAQYSDRAEQHAVSCGLVIQEAYQEIARQKALCGRGEKRKVMGKMGWLKLAGISHTHAMRYLAISDGRTTLEAERLGTSERMRRFRTEPKVPARAGNNRNDNTVKPTGYQNEEPSEVPEPDYWIPPPNPSADASLLVGGLGAFLEEGPHEEIVVVALKRLSPEQLEKATLRFLEILRSIAP